MQEVQSQALLWTTGVEYCLSPCIAAWGHVCTCTSKSAIIHLFLSILFLQSRRNLKGESYTCQTVLRIFKSCEYLCMHTQADITGFSKNHHSSKICQQLWISTLHACAHICMYLSTYTSVFVFTSVRVKLGFLSCVPILLDTRSDVWACVSHSDRVHCTEEPQTGRNSLSGCLQFSM